MIGLALLAIWPAAHHVIARANDFSPWKGFGWSMYCVPPRQVSTRVWVDGRDLLQPQQWRQLDPRAQRTVADQAKRFNNLRVEFGAWIEPRALAAAVLRAMPSTREIEVGVTEYEVDRASAKLAQKRPTTRYRFSPADPGRD